MKEAAPFIAFGVAIVLIRVRNRGKPAPIGLGGLPPRARFTLVAAWLLGFVGIIGASDSDTFGIALLPGGLLLLVCAWDSRGVEPPRIHPASGQQAVQTPIMPSVRIVAPRCGRRRSGA